MTSPAARKIANVNHYSFVDHMEITIAHDIAPGKAEERLQLHIAGPVNIGIRFRGTKAEVSARFLTGRMNVPEKKKGYNEANRYGQ